MVTGLIRAFFISYFQIPGIRARNPKLPILRGEKPALLFSFDWQNSFFMGWSIGKRKRPVFRIRNSPKKLRRKPAFLPSKHLTSEILLPGRVVNPNTAQIRKKTSTNVLDIPDLWPVWLSGTIPELKITTNSTCREATLN